MHSASEVEDWEVCFQFQAGWNPVKKITRLQLSNSDVRREKTGVWVDQAKTQLNRSVQIWKHLLTEIWHRRTLKTTCGADGFDHFVSTCDFSETF